MVKLRKIRNLIYLATLGAIGSLLILVNPMYLMLVLLSVFAVLALSSSINTYKIIMVVKHYTREAAKLRFEIQAILHTGFRDYPVTLDDENRTRSRTTGYIH